MQKMREDDRKITAQDMLLADAIETAINAEMEVERLQKENDRLNGWHYKVCYLICIAGIVASFIGLIGAMYG